MAKRCGGLTMAGCQAPTQSLSFPVLSRTRGENKIKNLKTQDIDREMDYLAIIIKNKTDAPSGKLIYSPSELDGEKKSQKLKHFPFIPFFSGSISLLLSWLLCVLLSTP